MAESVENLKKRIADLEAQIATLRVGRRVLLNLVARLQQEKKTETTRLEREKHALEMRNKRLARSLLDQLAGSGPRLLELPGLQQKSLK